MKCTSFPFAFLKHFIQSVCFNLSSLHTHTLVSYFTRSEDDQDTSITFPFSTKKKTNPNHINPVYTSKTLTPSLRKRKQINTLPTPYAILDIHFSPHDPNLLAVAASTGRLDLFRFDPATSELQPEKQLQLFDPEILVLSLAWHPVHANLIGVTVSSGEVYLVDVSSAAEDKAIELLKHELEAWTLAFSPDGNAVFSGGDDACLRFADGVVGAAAAEDGVGAQWCDRRTHGAGVTAILPLNEDDVTITGSYDDCIRVVKTVKVGRKQVLAEENLEGGVWRLKMLEEDQEKSR